ncbi:MAG: sugar ABC transporter permease, partial [Xanthobacteraceae bacterium]|nr:sugar ABC transporter permease [Xanthobacteraceae bacterium]
MSGATRQLAAAPSAPLVRWRRYWARMQRDHIGFVLSALGPILALFVLIRIYPIVETIRLSFYNYNITQRHNPFVGLANYIRLFNDDPFRTALLNTINFTILSVIVTLLLALSVAVLLRSIERTAPTFELLFYIPVVIPWVPAAVIWKWIYDPTYGALNYVLSG